MRAGLLLLALPGCAPAHRAGKFFAPADFVSPAPAHAISQVTYSSGWADESPRPYDPEPFRTIGGVAYVRPVPITTEGWIDVVGLGGDEPIETRLFVRHGGAAPRDFRSVVNLTGALDAAVPNELRFFPELGPQRIAVADLANAYAAEPVADGDLLLLQVERGDRTDHYVFRARDFGFRARFGAGVLIRIPLAGDEALSPALAGTLAVGFRPRTRQGGVEWVAEQLALVSSVGVGSTALETESSVSGAFNAALVGGGIQLFDFVSAQVLVNLSSFVRDDAEQSLALAIGFDAVQFARFTDRASARLFQRNELVAAPPEPAE